MKLSNNIQTKTKGYVFVSTARVGSWYETMVFRSDADGMMQSWNDLDKMIYQSASEAREGHKKMIEKWLNA